MYSSKSAIIVEPKSVDSSWLKHLKTKQ
jgi:hypothetical protein